MIRGLSVGVSGSCGVCAIGVHGMGMADGRLGIARHVVDGCGCAVDRSCLLCLELQLEFQQFELLLLLDQCQFGLGRTSGLRSLLLLLLAVEDQTGDEVAAKAEELGLGFVAAVA